VLIDVHAHFLHDRSPRSDWPARNASRLRAGDRVGITVHVASILGSWGATSPIYFPSPPDIEYGNDFLLQLQRTNPARIRGYAVVNPNFTTHALAELARCLDAGMIGIKLAASRRANDPLLDPICRAARERGVPVLQHIWQHRRREYPDRKPPTPPSSAHWRHAIPASTSSWLTSAVAVTGSTRLPWCAISRTSSWIFPEAG